ncbi:MAG: FAD-dependent oxidoreductase [Rhodospirillaceae bacterium]|jgi:dimethylamine/trimethylamine dehydrogenase|nr:FAD-dependent oxidoreductase [Rhodospirillaceae bacterium]MBT5245778.1 FAD-dependent oxidoreductase [Rhodospirillaceae bacterium]MBT5561621.1 FAD-dependent oxidoreductase [Rhodospirillaceae bacterium]MBT6241783.1 FAD-dependent oxidoreductase [Rhodospirillaceae bacterium]MBT7136783.1 FAD-dependent oxidoreductase [Rhodospirillaceae bacterium]
MTRDPRYDILFEPVKIGPVTAKNRFYQVPHCNGMGFNLPQSHAKMREMKAEGGWAVINTEECMIHPSSDYSPDPQARLWDGYDVKCLGLMTDAIHRHGALAGVQLAHHGVSSQNLYSRLKPIGPSSQTGLIGVPTQTRGMDKSDIREFRRWHRNAALRAREAEADIVYVYAGHDFTLLMHFLQKRRNHRTDEYGGSLENRVRLFREVLEDTKEAVGDRCAVVVRLAVDELLGEGGITSQGEGREIIEMLAEIPDLWDVNVSDWANDSLTSRFGEEGSQESYISFVKSVTTKPVVGVGWFTSPDTMASQVKRGVLDMIGAARPSIADPFLPRKIEEGRADEIRECIGCNICVAGQHTFTPMRCTQNPTMGEEWRRGWHPENIDAKGSEHSVLIVGAGPSGLEAARALGQRGYQVALAEATTELGGRVSWESSLPGLSAWARVRDWRTGRLQEMANVDVYFDSELSPENILEFGFDHVIIATGARWRKDGVGSSNDAPVTGSDSSIVFTPEDIVAGADVSGPVVVFDDDNFYMGGVVAEKLCLDGHQVTYVTTAACVSSWTENTLEQHRIQARLLELDIDIIVSHNLKAIAEGQVELACIYSSRSRTLAAGGVVMVTSRKPNNELYLALHDDADKLQAADIKSVQAIGDCDAPATIAIAVYDGHRAAREMDNPPANPDMPFRREYIELDDAV